MKTLLCIALLTLSSPPTFAASPLISVTPEKREIHTALSPLYEAYVATFFTVTNATLQSFELVDFTVEVFAYDASGSILSIPWTNVILYLDNPPHTAPIAEARISLPQGQSTGTNGTAVFAPSSTYELPAGKSFPYIHGLFKAGTASAARVDVRFSRIRFRDSSGTITTASLGDPRAFGIALAHKEATVTLALQEGAVLEVSSDLRIWERLAGVEGDMTLRIDAPARFFRMGVPEPE